MSAFQSSFKVHLNVKRHLCIYRSAAAGSTAAMLNETAGAVSGAVSGGGSVGGTVGIALGVTGVCLFGICTGGLCGNW